ncbi:hypothetical protein G6045_09555 [Streptomyces sp. YC504]|uniref:Zf-HC2 domain-containing protein n=1 Tax=Streptomyces mesophilus TaxID=1775132 RepID=A0A6G4XEC9_9ACTN|nr:hypothetical protein [Streptomyces mesophilus]NGO75916.1 hypothetical protein [Streptomyces mesophilus]
MTSTTGTAEHPEVSELSDLAEGLLPASRSAVVRRHLEDCVLCADVQASLEEIRALLGTLPTETRMPDEVAARIDAALATEVLLDVSRETQSHSERETAPAPDASADVSRETSPSQRPGGHPRGATGPGRSNAPRRRRRGAVAALGALATVAAVGIGTLVFLPDGSDQGPGTQATEKFSGGDLKTRVATLVASRTSAESASVGANSTSGETPTTPRTKDVPGVPECIARAIARDEEPLAAEDGTYKGAPAYLVVLPHASQTTRVSAYVVDAACLKEDQSTATGKVLLETSFPRN